MNTKGSMLARLGLPLLVATVLLGVWHFAVVISETTIFPTPWAVAIGIAELASQGLLFKYIVASLFRVTWGFLLAILVGVPLGLALGWFDRAFMAINPLIQILRPIS